MSGANVLRKCARSKQDVSAALAAGWGRVILGVGKGSFADRLETTVRTVDNALTGPSLPELHTALNSLCADTTALAEVLALYGVQATPIRAEPANDMELVSRLSEAMSEYLRRMLDGHRCHVDTAVLAKMFRPIIPGMQAIVDEADRAKGLAA